jgi:hypothetical protein
VSLTTAVRSVFRSAAKKFPGAAEADIAVYAKLIYEAAATNLKSTYKDEEAVGAADKELAEAAERGEAWAENLRDSVLVNVVKPVVDKANEKGVDPVSALVLADFTEEQAREYVAALADRADDTDADADSDADSDDSADEAGSDDDTTGSTDAVSYGYGSPVASH